MASDERSTPDEATDQGEALDDARPSQLPPPHPRLRWHSSLEGRARSLHLLTCRPPGSSSPLVPWPSVASWPDAAAADDLTYQSTMLDGSTSEPSPRSDQNGRK